MENTLDTLMDFDDDNVNARSSPFYYGGEDVGIACLVDDEDVEGIVKKDDKGGDEGGLCEFESKEIVARRGVLKGDCAEKRRVNFMIMGKRSAREGSVEGGSRGKGRGRGKGKSARKGKVGGRRKKVVVSGGVEKKKRGRKGSGVKRQVESEVVGKREPRRVVPRLILDQDLGMDMDEFGNREEMPVMVKVEPTLLVENVDDVNLQAIRDSMESTLRDVCVRKHKRMSTIRKECLSSALKARLETVITGSTVSGRTRSKGMERRGRRRSALPQVALAVEAVEKAAKKYSLMLGKDQSSNDEWRGANEGTELFREFRKSKNVGCEKNIDDHMYGDPAVSALQKYLDSPIQAVGGRRRIVAPQ